MVKFHMIFWRYQGKIPVADRLFLDPVVSIFHCAVALKRWWRFFKIVPIAQKSDHLAANLEVLPPTSGEWSTQGEGAKKRVFKRARDVAKPSFFFGGCILRRRCHWVSINFIQIYNLPMFRVCFSKGPSLQYIILMFHFPQVPWDCDAPKPYWCHNRTLGILSALIEYVPN